ncbi:hypothetical protein HDZ31DRAFT_68281 [Schizophyllum fasciatum]
MSAHLADCGVDVELKNETKETVRENAIEYQQEYFGFKIDTISAVSAHPVRNSRDELIVGEHILWDCDAADRYIDGQRGSFAPNIFAYDFLKPRGADFGYISVTVRATDSEPSGAEVVLYGVVDNEIVMRTDHFFLKSLAPVTIQAHLVPHAASDKPFAWNADVQWRMELGHSAQAVASANLLTTPLELYWIAETIHRAFQNGIPVGFLRDVLKKSPAPAAIIEAGSGGMHATDGLSEFYAEMARQCFFDFNKIYDTAGGASACNVGIWGGIFYESYYRAPDENGLPGTLAKRVNCMDQAAMLSLLCSILTGFPATSWLAQKPFGFIQPINLVGVLDGRGGLLTVNNPFFGTDIERAHVPDNDGHRTLFGCHVYVGHSKPYDGGGIYDACGGREGPHCSETATQYVEGTIDMNTGTQRGIPYGTAANIQEGDGVTGIDGHHTVYPSVAPPNVAFSRAVLELFDRLVACQTAADAANIAHVGWAQVPVWLSAVLGDAWVVRYENVTAADGCARAFFHLADTSSADDAIRVNVSVHTVASADGMVDVMRSGVAARDCAVNIIGSVDRDPDTLWERGALDEFGDWSVRYGPNVRAGRVIVGAGNAVVDISGMSSTAALEGHARRLLQHVVRRDAPPLTMPVLREGLAAPLTASLGVVQPEHAQDVWVRVEGVDVDFTLYFEAGGPIASAAATCETGAILFDKFEDERELPPREGQESEGGRVRFTFITRELGAHEVRIHVADGKSMVTKTYLVNVKVV